MDTLLEAALRNAAVVAVLVPIVSVFGHLCRRPALVHSLWLLILLKLFTPPLWPLSLSGLAFIDAGQAARAPNHVGAAADPSEEMMTSGVATAAPLDPASETRAARLVPAGSTAGIKPAARQPESREEDMAIASPYEDTATILQTPPTAPTMADSLNPLSWRGWLVIVWLAGSGLWLTVAALRIYRFKRILCVTQRAPPELQIRVRVLAERLGLAACPEVWIAPAPISPLLWALPGPPRLLLPQSLLQLLTREQWDTLLAHELAHLRRGDHWVRLLELASLGLYWWHPLVWWARRELREAEEQCCDAWVVWALPGAADTYASTLVEALTYLSNARTALPLAASGIGHVHLLKRRLTMIMRGTSPRRLSTAGSLAVLGLAMVLLPLYPSWGQTEQRRQGANNGQTTDPTGTGAIKTANSAEAPDEPAPGGSGGVRYGANNPLLRRPGPGSALTETVDDAQDDVDLLRVQLHLRQAERREVQARLRQAQQDKERLSRLGDRGAVDRAEVEHANTEVEVQEARLAAKDAQIQEAELRLKQAERRLARTRESASPRGGRAGVTGGRPAGPGPFGAGSGGGAGFGSSSGTTPFSAGPGAPATGGMAGFSGGQPGGFAGGGGFSGMPGLGSPANFDQRLKEVENKLQTLIDEMKALRQQQPTDRQQPKKS